jgi:hypothetical protein
VPKSRKIAAQNENLSTQIDIFKCPYFGDQNVNLSAQIDNLSAQIDNLSAQIDTF